MDQIQAMEEQERYEYNRWADYKETGLTSLDQHKQLPKDNFLPFETH